MISKVCCDLTTGLLMLEQHLLSKVVEHLLYLDIFTLYTKKFI
ncbi:hypothetical protein [Selenomonas sp.]|nr:hypothetical protein [Selenomonas sp.]